MSLSCIGLTASVYVSKISGRHSFWQHDVFARDAMASEIAVAHDGVLQTFAEHYGPVVDTAEIEAIWRRVL